MSMQEKFTELSSKVGHFANTKGPTKSAQQWYLRKVQQRWMTRVFGRRLFTENVDWLINLKPDRGIILAANHRTFFDFYVTMLALYKRGITWGTRQYYPVRKDFFYDKPSGAAMNFMIGGGVMYPPIFRTKGNRSNQQAVEFLKHVLDDPRTIVGIHPEGKRSKTDNPYELLRVQPGVGQLALRTKAIVIPIFINGISNDVAKVLKSGRSHAIGKESPITITCGDAMDFSKYDNENLRTTVYQRASGDVRAAITALGQKEKVIREDILSGKIKRDDHRWLEPTKS